MTKEFVTHTLMTERIFNYSKPAVSQYCSLIVAKLHEHINARKTPPSFQRFLFSNFQSNVSVELVRFAKIGNNTPNCEVGVLDTIIW